MSTLEDEIRRLRRFTRFDDAEALPRAHGPGLGSGSLRARVEDFAVSEDLGTDFAGEGEFLYLRVRKVGQNTRWVARQLAASAGIAYRAVSFAGLKDRHAVAEQWFCLHLPGQGDPDWTTGLPEGVTLLDTARHTRKLRQGQLSFNRFRLRVRDCAADQGAVAARIEQIRAGGFPNYFGPQRFGHDARNLEIVLRARDLRRLPRETRGFALSALRSALFNGVLAERLHAGTWGELLPGEDPVSDRSRGAAEDDIRLFLPERSAAGPLWGKGYRGRDALERFEHGWLEEYPAVTGALERAGSRFARRVLRARAAELEHAFDGDSLEVGFALGPGSFATMLLREILDVDDRARIEQGTD